jgi:hypothetical protein
VGLLPTAPRRRPTRSRRRSTLLSALIGPLLAWSFVVPGAIAAADQDHSGVRAVTTSTAALAAGGSGWVAVVWAADRTVQDWSTTVTAPPGVGVSYPTTRGGADTSLYGSATLVGGTTDFTAFRLAVPYTQRTGFPVTVTSTYTRCGDNGQCKDQGLGNDGRTGTTTATVTVPVVPATGPPFTQDTTELSVVAGSSSFQQIAFTGGQADLADFTVRLGALPAGLEVAYPGDRSATTPAGGSSLAGRHTDRVGLRLVATGLPPGRYTVPLTISYTAAQPTSTPGTVTLVVQ